MSEREPFNTGSPEAPVPLSAAKPAPKQSPANRGLVIALIVVSVVAVSAIFAAIFTPRTFDPTGPVGTVVSEDSYIGTWGSGIQSLTLTRDGEAHGTDGCNGQGSRWSFAGDRVNFEGFMGTMMACLDDDDKMINGWLGQASSAKIIGPNLDELVFYGQSGEELGSMVRGAVADPRVPAPGEGGPLVDPAPQPVEPDGGIGDLGTGTITPEPRPMPLPQDRDHGDIDLRNFR